MLTSIAGKSVVVSGASKGIGKGIARVFARNGAKVTIVARHRAEAKAAAKELGGDASAGIADVTNLSEIITEGLESLGPEYHKTMAASVPLKRLGTAEDIGYAALFLASKEAGLITGQTIVVDGGQILPESLEALD